MTQATLYEVLLQADPGDGNDLIEASVGLPMIPRKGDLIEVWNSLDGMEMWLEVVGVTLCAWAPERIVVSVRMDGYDLADLRRAFEAAAGNEQP